MIDHDSDPGAWRAALDPEGRSCRACGQNVCGCPDLVFQGVTPPTDLASTGAPARDRRIDHPSNTATPQ